MALIRIPGRVLRWIRWKAGWSRARLSFMLSRNPAFAADARSSKSLERYEALVEVAPLVAERYRETLGPELFDALLEESRENFPEMKRHDGKAERVGQEGSLRQTGKNVIQTAVSRITKRKPKSKGVNED